MQLHHRKHENPEQGGQQPRNPQKASEEHRVGAAWVHLRDPRPLDSRSSQRGKCGCQQAICSK